MKLELNDLIEYEICASWWANYIGNKWLQKRAADYFIWKTKRKYRRYFQIMKLQEEIENRRLIRGR